MTTNEVLNKLFERLTGMLGRPYDECCFQALHQDLGELPEIWRGSTHRAEYVFKRHGFQLSCDHDIVTSLFLHWGSEAVKSGSIERYLGNLPGGVRFGDDICTVGEKLSIDPAIGKRIQGRTADEPKDLWVEFRFGGLKANLIFDGADDKLRSVGVRLERSESNQPEEPGPNDQELYSNLSADGRLVIQYAAEEARKNKHNFIGSEHLLLGLLMNKGSMACSALCSLEMTIGKARKQVLQIIGKGRAVVGQDIPMTPRARLIIDQARTEAQTCKSEQVNSEHILLAMTADGEGVAARILWTLDVDLELLRDRLQRAIEQ